MTSKAATLTPDDVDEANSRVLASIPIAEHEDQMHQLAGVVVVDGTIETSLGNIITKIQQVNAILPCKENLQMLHHLQQALSWQEARQDTRKAQGVEGSNIPHTGPHLYVCTTCGATADIHVH